MALRATFALFAAAITLIIAGPLSLGFTDAALRGEPVSLMALLGLEGGGAPIALLIFGFCVAVLAAAVALVIVWLPVHALLDAAGLRGWIMYAATGYAVGGCLAGLIAGPWGFGALPLVTAMMAGSTAGAACTTVFWLIRRPDWN